MSLRIGGAAIVKVASKMEKAISLTSSILDLSLQDECENLCHSLKKRIRKETCKEMYRHHSCRIDADRFGQFGREGRARRAILSLQDHRRTPVILSVRRMTALDVGV